jgi:hypothetical protein
LIPFVRWNTKKTTLNSENSSKEQQQYASENSGSETNGGEQKPTNSDAFVAQKRKFTVRVPEMRDRPISGDTGDDLTQLDSAPPSADDKTDE